MTAIASCPRCGNDVTVRAMCGGRGTGETTAYEAACNARCGYRLTELPSNASGRRSDAIREHNREAEYWPASPPRRNR